jgi:hypothetical protein
MSTLCRIARRVMRIEHILTWCLDWDRPPQGLIDLLADARHWCDRHGESFAALDRRAYQHYLTDIHTERSHAMPNLTDPSPLVLVTVRGGVAVDVTATLPLQVVIEDWDCPDLATGEAPYRHIYFSADLLPARKVTQYRCLIDPTDSESTPYADTQDQGGRP